MQIKYLFLRPTRSPGNASALIGTCASYRTIIQVDRYINIDEDKMAISLPGLPSGNYRVYIINGGPGKAFMVSRMVLSSVPHR